MNFCPPCAISRSHIGDILGSDACVVTWMYTIMSGEPAVSMVMAEANRRFLRNVGYISTKLHSVIPQVMLYFSSKLPHKDISPPISAHISFRHHPRHTAHCTLHIAHCTPPPPKFYYCEVPQYVTYLLHGAESFLRS